MTKSKTSQSHKGLGKGLGALLTSDGVPEIESASVVNIKITDINPNSEQPRKSFDKKRLEELASSIKENGIIIPIIVKKEGNAYKIVAGERRWRAAKIAGLTMIPSIIRDLTDLEIMQQALIENIQRQDLNPIEEADALNKLIKDHSLTQEKLANTVGRSRPAITNALRLLNLPEEVKDMVIRDDLTAGHARALLALPEKELQLKAAAILIERDASVRDAEKLVKQLLKPPKQKKEQDSQYISSILEFESRLSGKLGTKVKLKDKNKKGSIVIEYYSYDDLDRIYELIAGKSR
ncbi:MAG: ParB/RepB/Spo0J family partition protein [Eubacteriales bacterium]|jgi:ParB family chromosome partitioning protein|nr:ParB/RepB/Spo0J family partition protein [Eubacteriales bacterium]MDD4327920.1 ParB/RepB/Spo0J family partition protein [Eubacteriales bacterium]